MFSLNVIFFSVVIYVCDEPAYGLKCVRHLLGLNGHIMRCGTMADANQLPLPRL